MKHLFLILVAATLAACGGGGDAGPDATTVNADAVVTRALSQGIAIEKLKATDHADGVYLLTLRNAAADTASFLETSKTRSLQTITVDDVGKDITTRTSQIFFSAAPVALSGLIQANGQVRVYEPAGRLPAEARPGDHGTLNTFTVYPSSTVAIPVGSGTTTWSVEADTASSNLVCLSYASPPLATEKYCYKADASGAIIGAQVTLSFKGLLLTFK